MDNEKKPNVLRNMKISSVSVVDQGANQHAHIKVAKRAEGEPEEESGTNPVENDEAVFARIGKMIAKALHIDKADSEEITRGDAVTFEQIEDNRELADKIWRITDALNSSLFSILRDKDITGEQKAAMITQTADQVAAAIKTDIAGKIGGEESMSKGAEEPGEEGAGNMPTETQDSQQPAVEDKPVKTEPVGKQHPAGDTQQEGDIDMKFNKSAMTPEEKAQLEELEKKYGVVEETPEEAKPEYVEDIYKGLHPAVKAEMENLRKFREEAENRELNEIAKRYTIIGKKPEELVPMLKSLRAAGGTAYDDMIALLDSTKEAVEKSGVFGEIGKSGSAAGTGDSAWNKIEKAAAEVMSANVNMTRAQAIEKVCDEHPELVAEYENGRK